MKSGDDEIKKKARALARYEEWAMLLAWLDDEGMRLWMRVKQAKPEDRERMIGQGIELDEIKNKLNNLLEA